jgi:hypothetical protein
MGNSRGSYYSTAENKYAAYDKLPPSAKKALQDAAFDWAVQPIKTYWTQGRKGFKTGKDIAARVAEWDKKHIAKDRKRVWKIED